MDFLDHNCPGCGRLHEDDQNWIGGLVIGPENGKVWHLGCLRRAGHLTFGEWLHRALFWWV